MGIAVVGVVVAFFALLGFFFWLWKKRDLRKVVREQAFELNDSVLNLPPNPHHSGLPGFYASNRSTMASSDGLLSQSRAV